MSRTQGTYKAIVSSDWSECLSPNGPFDPIAHNYPHLTADLERIFREYTGNRISLTKACAGIAKMLPELLTADQMDDYLKESFRTYKNVPELIQWCLDRDVLFMINTTGTQGYFQRALAAKMIPHIPVVSANPMIGYLEHPSLVRYDLHVLEIEDKAVNTRIILGETGLSPDRLLVMGDSGGDGPHFRWGAEVGAHLVGSMTKGSLVSFCKLHGISIGTMFGLSYDPGETRNEQAELQVDFMDLTGVIGETLGV
jgi:hypothetical protein